MKKSLLGYILFTLLTFCGCLVHSQGVISFTDLDSPNVTCYYGSFDNPKENIGKMPNRHQVITTQGYDRHTDFNLPFLPDEDCVAVVKLGNDQTNKKAECITYRIPSVDHTQSILLLRFAVVFEDPGDDHEIDERPRFVVKVTTPDGELVETCAEYDVRAYGEIEGFIASQSEGNEDVRWRPWTSVGIDLSSYIGQEINVEFYTYDCNEGAHYGYAYYTASFIQSRFEFDDGCVNPITIKAPDFFASYTWNNGDVSQYTTYTLTPEPLDIQCTLESVTGCEFTLKAHLMYDDELGFDDTLFRDTICIGNEYHKNYFDLPTFEEPGDYTFINTLLNFADCEDVVVSLMLHVAEEVPSAVYDENICTGEEYHGHGFDTIGKEPGLIIMQKDTLSVFGCDSTAYLYLNVRELYDIDIYDTMCYGTDYDRYNFFFEMPSVGDHNDTTDTLSMFGCDSTVRLYLHVNPIYDNAFFDTICYGNSYHGQGFDIESEDLHVGMNYDTLYFQTKLGCDSTDHLELYVAPIYSIDLYDTSCFGQVYDRHGFYLENLEVGIKLDTLKTFSMYGCDSIVNLELFVAPIYDTAFVDTICGGYGYHKHGFNIEDEDLVPGMNYDTVVLPTIYGCDSVLTIELFVHSDYHILIQDTICFGQNYHKYNFDTINPPVGMCYMEQQHITILGCDSVINLELYVAPDYDIVLRDTICHGEDYHNYNFDTIQPGIGTCFMQQYLSSIVGCDSVVVMYLFVAPAYDTLFVDTICQNEGYHSHGFELDSLNAGMHLDTLHIQTIYRCDSIVYLELCVWPTHDTTFIDTICQGNGYYRHGFEIDTLDLELGMNYDTLFLQTIYGCDSTVKLELFVAPTYDTTFYDTICYRNGYYEHGFEIDSLVVGMNYDTLFLQTIYDCDSIVKLELFVAPVFDTTFYDTICFGEEYHNHGFDYDDTDSLEVGIKYDTLFLQTIYDCDSTVKLELFVAPVFDTTFYDTICYGNGYQGHGFEIDSTSLHVGTNYDVLYLQTIYDCDSMVYLELYVAPVYDTILVDTICYGEDYHGYNFDTIHPAPGICVMQQQLLTASFGCDSIVTMNLIVGELYDINIIDTACYGNDYDEYGFHFDLPDVGSHYDTLFLTSMYGCDSTVMLELYVAPIYDTTFFDTICYGNSYYEHGFEIEKPEVGLNLDTLFYATTLNCDSLVYLRLYVADVYDITLADSICFGEDYHLYNFDTINPAPGNCFMQQQLLTVFGCDSIVTMNLFVGEVYNPVFNDTICFGEDYDKHNFHLVNPPVGLNAETQQLSSVYDCDSIVDLRLYVAPIYYTDTIDSICEGEDYTRYGLNIIQPEPGFYEFVSELKTELGCDSIFHINLEVIHTYKTPDTIKGDDINVFVSSNLMTGIYYYYVDSIPGCEEYIWSVDNKDWIVEQMGDSCSVTVTTPVVAVLTVTAGNSCGVISQSIELHASHFGVEENNGIITNVYPNPSRTFVNIESENIMEIKLLTVSGVVIKSEKFDHENKVTIDLNGIPDALYLIEIKTSEGLCIRRITITNN